MDNYSHNLFKELHNVIEGLDTDLVQKDRKQILQPLVNYIQSKVNNLVAINLNFICTHNSRRSHLSQIWARTLAVYYNIKDVHCYSGGTEATAMFPMVVETLVNAGFNINTISEGTNPVYSIKNGDNNPPIIGFSKTFDDSFNPKSNFAAIMTCNHADENCPFIPGAEQRIPVTYIDPKVSDNTPNQKQTYHERSLQIATEMKYVFSNINHH
ncbi:MAG: protein-tyrosine-phosphatase [Bacteroidia bacterium]|nr:protein-tyrosine-phosphatase [Bacteroidia bacterium]